MFYMMSSFDFFFAKQKTAYEMRISDWSSDVCSSDLVHGGMVWRGLQSRRYQSRRNQRSHPVKAAPEIGYLFSGVMMRLAAALRRAAIRPRATLIGKTSKA